MSPQQIDSPEPTKNMRIGFAGTPEFAAQHLRALIEANLNVVGVWTQPDRPAGRGKHTQPSPVKCLAEKKDIPVLQPQKLLQPDQAAMASLNLDLLVVVAYGLILPQEVLDTPRNGCINVHASLLPRWRGAAPIQRAIEAGDSETGVCIMQMDAGLDTGDVLARCSFPLRAIDTAGMVHDRLIEQGAPLLVRTIEEIAKGHVKAEKQMDEQTTYAAKITKAEAEIDWSQSASVLDRKIRAFNPTPMAFTKVGEDRIRIWQAYPLPDDRNSEAGVVGQICAANAEGIDIQCGQGILRLKELQLPGKTPTAVAELLRGNASRFQVGTFLGNENLDKTDSSGQSGNP
jgi:methionyl-tRNA formyltransferase